jgi:hypothetical protein
LRTPPAAKSSHHKAFAAAPEAQSASFDIAAAGIIKAPSASRRLSKSFRQSAEPPLLFLHTRITKLLADECKFGRREGRQLVLIAI